MSDPSVRRAVGCRHRRQRDLGIAQSGGLGGQPPTEMTIAAEHVRAQCPLPASPLRTAQTGRIQIAASAGHEPGRSLNSRSGNGSSSHR